MRGRPRKIKEIVLPPTYEHPATVPKNNYVQVDFTVTITYIPSKLVCPNCNKVQFDCLEGEMHGQLRKKCDRCKKYILYLFRIFPFPDSTASSIV